MDVRLPDGTIIKGVPDGMSKADLTAKLQANGYDISKLTTPAAPQLPESLRPRAAEAQSEVPMGRRVIEFVRPTVEALGAVGGGLLGGGGGMLAGPVGTALGGVAGAGMGYAAAKGGLDVLSQALGYEKPPATFGEGVTRGVSDVVTGATYEAGGRLAAPVIGKVVGKVAEKTADLFRSPTTRAADIARSALGKDAASVVQQLKAANPNASVAEITAGVENPTWQALVNRALERDPQFVRKMNAMGEKESLNALAQLVGGTTATDVRAGVEASKKTLNALTGPQREAALNRANLGRAVAGQETEAQRLAAQAVGKVEDVRRLTQLGQQAEAAAAKTPVRAPSGERIGMPLAPGRYTYAGDLAKKADEWASQAATASLDLGQGARFAQGAADALRSVGIKPLEVQPLIGSLQAVGRNPEFAGNDLISGALKNVADDIAKWTSSGGVVDARALDAIRKNSVNAAIQQLRPGVDATTQRNLAAGVLTKIRPAITDAIESAGGVGYKDYLATHAAGMQKLAERELKGEALRLWKSDKDAFVRLVQNESPDVVEKFLGSGKYNIATELADNTMDALRQQANKRLTELSVKAQVSEGQAALTELLKQNTAKFKLPSFLSFWATASNKALDKIESAVGKKTMDALTAAMKSPENAANLLQAMPAKDRSVLLSVLQDTKLLGGVAPPSRAATGVQSIRSGISNMLAPESQPQNALAP
jgi:hypothetical protein